MAVYTVSVSLRAELAQWAREWNNSTNAVRDGRNEIVRTAAAQREAARDISNSMGVQGAALVAGFSYAIKLTSDYTSQLSAVEAATRESAEGMQALGDAALQAGINTVYSATEAAAAEEELAKAGINTADILGGGLTGALSLAAAGGIEVADAAETAATALKLFNLDGSQMPHVADLMAAAAGNAQGGVHDLGMALNQSGLVAAQFGLSIEETIGTLGAFASAGFLGSDAGTSFKTMLLRMAAPSGEAIKLMKQLGIAAYDASGNFVGISDLAGQLKTKLGLMTQEQRDATLATLFGSDAIRAANILYREGEEGIEGWIDKVDQTGYASDVAATRLNNLGGDLEKLQGSFETNLIQAGLGADGMLRGLTQSATGVMDAMGTLPPAMTSTALTLVGVTGVGLATAGALGRLAVSSAETKEALRELEVSGDGWQRKLAGQRAGIIRMSIAFAGLQAIMASIGGPAAADMTELSESLKELGRTGVLGGEALRILGKDMQLFKGDAEALMNNDAWTNVGEGFATAIETLTGTGTTVEMSLQNGRRRIQEIDAALAALVQSGYGQTAVDLVNQLAEAAADKGVNIHELAAALPKYQSALEGATSTETDAIDAAEAHSNAMDVLNGSVQDAIESAGGLREAFDLLNGGAIETDTALINASDAVRSLQESLAENGKSFDIATEAGGRNRDLLIAVTQAAADAAAAKYAETGSVKEANDVYAKYIDMLSGVLDKAGVTDTEIKKLIDRYGAMPAEVYTDLENDSKKESEGVLAYDSNLDGIPDTVSTDVHLDISQGLDALEFWRDALIGAGGDTGWSIPDTLGGSPGSKSKRKKKRADGGQVGDTGAGPRADDIPVMLSSREYIVNATDADRNLPVLERINAGMSALEAVGGMQPTVSRPVMGSPVQTTTAAVSKVQVSFDFTGMGDDLARAMQKHIRITGGGNVQLALGRSS